MFYIFSRVGMMGWSLLTITFASASCQINGFNAGSVVNAALINLYLLKFFYWETGYFNTLDITLDRAGYYLCWGCLVWVQVRDGSLALISHFYCNGNEYTDEKLWLQEYFHLYNIGICFFCKKFRI